MRSTRRPGRRRRRTWCRARGPRRALLPLFAGRGLGGSAGGYGLVLGSVGVGATVGGGFLPRGREGLTSDRLVMAGTAAFAAVSAVVALARVPMIAGGGIFIG